MIGLKFLASLASVAFIGFAVAPRRLTNDFSWSARVPLLFGIGAVFLTVEMVVFSVVGLKWFAPTLLLAPILLGGVKFWKRERIPAPAGFPIGRSAVPGLAAALLGLLILTYAAGTARITSTDLLLYWGSKGQRFAQVRAFDFAFLAAPDHNPLLVPDYPPLLPCLYAWSALGSSHFPWGAALLTLPLLAALSAWLYWSLARPALGDRRAGEFSAVFVLLLGFGMMESSTAGNAEPVLLFFETAAIALVMFTSAGNPTCELMTSVMLAGAVLAKVEGTTFAALLVGLVWIRGQGTGRNRASLWRLGLFPAAALAGWMMLCAKYGLIDHYGWKHGATLYPEYLPLIVSLLVKNASYEASYLPWVLLLILAIVHRENRIRWMPALLGAGLVAANVGYYLRASTDPAQWVNWSANRVLLSPLLCFFFVAATPARRAGTVSG